MIVSFFEEFPARENLDKLKLITWPSKLYLAAKSVQEFEEVRKSIKNKKIQEIIYWPVLQRKEGYWISPFSQRRALLRIFAELKNKNIPVMLDLELPTTQNPFLYITQSLNFFANKSLIRHFITHYPGQVYLAEYFIGKGGRKFLQCYGLHYEDNKAKIIPMMYHSLHPLSEEKVRQEFSNAKTLFGEKCVPGLGTIAHGILGIEPILSVELFLRDLKLAQEAGFKEVVIFRLGGLEKKYVNKVREHEN